MARSTATREETQGGEPHRFVLYVEGARDRGLVEAWAHRVSRHLARAVARQTVILGGCRPARAAEHLSELRDRDPGTHGLCVLDRDGEERPLPAEVHVPGLDFFRWRRRHIESYLLVPTAIRRSLRLPRDDSSIDQFFRRELPHVDDETAMQRVEAKSLFGVRGDLARWLGRPVHSSRVARVMHERELHPEVHDLLGRLRAALGVREVATLVRRF